jgi:energy-coupling factor transporter ATP-binding protein EcfA2
MRILDLVKIAPRLYEAGNTVHLIGPPGCGKSQVIQHEITQILSDKYGEPFGFYDSLAPTLDAPDYKGFLLPVKNPDGTAGSAFTRSPELPSREYLEEHPRGIYLVDELSSSELLTQKALAPVLLSKRFGSEVLPAGWQVWAASNRMSDRAGVVRQPTHIRNRVREINLENDALSWAVWAEAHGIHPLIIAWAKTQPTIAFANEVPATDRPFSTARSLARAAELLQVGLARDTDGKLIEMELPMDELTMESVFGDIGEGAGANLFGFLKVYDKLPTLDEIEADPKKAKCPSDLSAGWAAGQMCIHYAKPTNIDKLWQYTERLPKEVQVSMAKSLLERSGSVLLNSPSLVKWIHSNKALITSSTGK